MPDLTRQFITGQPGEAWSNDGDRAKYQYICQLSHSCGVCISYHLMIGDWWPIPLHRSCACNQVVILPGSTARPFADFQQIWDDLTPQQQLSAVGKSAYTLIEEGVVDFTDVVSPTHVLTLQEVVAEQGLTVDEMVGAGVRRDIAERAYAAANTPAAILDQQRRQQLIDQIRDAGLSDAQIRDLVGEAITERVGITSGPSGPQSMPPSGVAIPPELISILQRYDIPSTWRPGSAPPTQPEPPSPLLAAAEDEAGVEFIPNHIAADNPGYVTVVIDISRVDAEWAADDNYIEPGGGGAIGGRYENFQSFLEKAREDGTAIEQPRAGLDSDGNITLGDGRHRLAVFRDEGQTTLPISVPADDAAAIVEKYGASLPE